MNNKAHLRPKDFDSNGDIIPDSVREDKEVMLIERTHKQAISTLREMLNLRQPCENCEREYCIPNCMEYRALSWAIKELELDRPKGKWIYQPNHTHLDNVQKYHCSTNKCGWQQNYKTNFCPNCGAKMDKGGAE